MENDYKRSELLQELSEVEIKSSQLLEELELEEKGLADNDKVLHDNYESIILIEKIQIEGIDALIDILKNILSISLTGWIALLALPTILKAGFVLHLCIGLCIISLVLIIIFSFRRNHFKNELVLKHVKRIQNNIQNVKTHNLGVSSRLKKYQQKSKVLSDKIQDLRK